MNGKGDQVFGDNLDDILSEKIIKHTKLSERGDIKETKTEKRMPQVVLIALLALIITVISLAIKGILLKKQRKKQ